MSILAAVPGRRAPTNQNTSCFQSNHQNLSINTARTSNKIRAQWDWLVRKRKEKEECNNTNKIQKPGNANVHYWSKRRGETRSHDNGKDCVNGGR